LFGGVWDNRKVGKIYEQNINIKGTEYDGMKFALPM
jgi:hypothetical protein